MSEETFEFEVHVNGEWVAGTSGSERGRALTEAMHYARQYANDGKAEVFEVKRVWVAEVIKP